MIRGLAARFTVPVGGKTLCLVSATSRPRDIGRNDARDLDLCLAALTIGDGFASRAIDLADPLLCAGLHATEDGLRWTSGRMPLPAALRAETAGDFFLRLDLAGVAGTPEERRAELHLVA